MSSRRARLLALLVGIALVVVVASPAFAPPNTTQTGHRMAGGPVRQLLVITDDRATTYHSTNYLTVFNAGTNITIPAGGRALVKAQFDAESQCSSRGVGWCSVRIMIGGIEGNPQAGIDFAFDSDMSGPDDDLLESHSLTRARCVANTTGSPLTVSVVVQAAVTAKSITFRLDDWELDVYRTSTCTQTA
jgi:hypothetical protein